MASNIEGLPALAVNFTILLTRFGLTLNETTEPRSLNGSIHSKLNVTCVADAYRNNSVMNIQITRQDLDKPIVTFMDQNVTMGPNNTDNMQVDGRIDNNSRKSYLSLMINNPSHEEAGSYRCQMVALEESVKPIENSLTASVAVDEWILSIITKPEPYDIITHNELTITCIVDGPRFLDMGELKIQITRQNQDEPIATFVKQNLTMGPSSKENMKAEGNIDDKSYLSLIINNPTIQDAGTYKCRMDVFQKGKQYIRKSITASVTFKEHDITHMVSYLMTTVRTLKRKLNDVQSGYDEHASTLNTFSRNSVNIENHELQLRFLRNKLACIERGWTFYERNQTCLKAFGKYNDSEHVNWYDARQECKKFGADLVEIRDVKKNKFVSGLFKESDYEISWIGIRSHEFDAEPFRYLDGSILGYYQPFIRQKIPKNAVVALDQCVAMYTNRTHKQRSWYFTECSKPLLPYVCSISFNGCPNAEWTYYKPDQTCIKLFSNKENGTRRLSWKNAMKVCKKFNGGGLIQIDDKDKNQLVYRYVNTLGGAPWIGVRSRNRSRIHYKYADGTPLGEYQPWKRFPHVAGDRWKRCVGMDHWTGKWKKVPCKVTDFYVCSTKAIV